MLTADQVSVVWDKTHQAKVRSLYFADLVASCAKRKQWVTGLSFVLSSGAAMTALAAFNAWVPTSIGLVSAALGLAVAILAGYSIAVNLDQRILLLMKLHMSWKDLSNEYQRLRQHADDDDAERVLEQLLRRAGDISGEACVGAPYKKEIVEKWEDFVYSQLGADAA